MNPIQCQHKGKHNASSENTTETSSKGPKRIDSTDKLKPNALNASKKEPSTEDTRRGSKRSNDARSDLPISEDIAINQTERILTCCDTLFDTEPKGKPWFIKQQDRVPILFLRRMFTKLWLQQQEQRKKESAADSTAEAEFSSGSRVQAARDLTVKGEICVKAGTGGTVVTEPEATGKIVAEFDRGLGNSELSLTVLTTDISKAPTANEKEEEDQNETSELNRFISTEAFQRAFERLFFALGEDDGFDSTAYDKNNDSQISWNEFTYVFNKHKFYLKLTMPERIYLTFDNPDSSILAQFIQILMLSTIIVSSLGFILSTSPDFREEPVGLAAPKPFKIFTVVENVCLTIFLVEYVIRLFTCWSVRAEVINKDRLMALVVGDDVLEMSTPINRFFKFLFAPANIIDLVAIVPGVLGWFMTLEGGGFVVLRLVRLTRIFRAFKNPKLVMPVIVIQRTMKQSTKALYLLAFNGMLGILISGSLMYLVEKGDWDEESRQFKRHEGRSWNKELGVWEDIKNESPFFSIPHAFWWSIVTATTVGYGDNFPTTTGGYFVASLTMVFSLVIAALPVGVIGGNFSNCWDEYAEEVKDKAEADRKDKKFITEAIQRTDPFKISELLYIEIWNDRCADTKGLTKQKFPDGENNAARGPDLAEFMGQAHCLLDIYKKDEFGKKGAPLNLTKFGTETLEIREHAEGPLHKRKVTGKITIEYDWTPQSLVEATPDDPAKKNPLVVKEITLHVLYGQLKVRVVSAEGLINMNYAEGRRTFANPYAKVFCYPNGPSEKLTHTPVAWRTPVCKGKLSPDWDASHVFQYEWFAKKANEAVLEVDKAEEKLEEKKEEATMDRMAATDGSNGPMTKIVKQLANEIENLKRHLNDLTSNTAD